MESVLLQYGLYKGESQSCDAIPIVTFNVLVGQGVLSIYVSMTVVVMT